MMSTIMNSLRKPVIMCPDNILKGIFIPKKEVLEILASREDYQEYMMWLTEDL